MYLMYVDESGDPGLNGSPVDYFVLSGLVVHESDWRIFISKLLDFRKTMRRVYGLPMRAEIHASNFINKAQFEIKRQNRLAILRNFLDELAKIKYLSVTNVIVDKRNKTPDYDVFENAWKLLFQRFENTLNYGNFPGNYRNDFGMVLTDNTNGSKLTRLMRKMAVYNIVPNDSGTGNRNIPITKVIEDPHPKDSEESLPIQACDLCAYFLYQKLSPNAYIKKNGAYNYFSRLRPILNLRASRTDGDGIVRV